MGVGPARRAGARGRDALARHIQREEGEIFPRIARAWSRDRLEQAGTEMSGMQAGKTARP